MSGFTEFGAAAIAAGTALPQTVYVKLHSGDPGVNALFNQCAETTRAPMTMENADEPWDRWNDDVVSWTTTAANETANHISLWSAAIGGNPWYIGELSPALELTLGGDAEIGAGNIRMTVVRHS